MTSARAYEHVRIYAVPVRLIVYRVLTGSYVVAPIIGQLVPVVAKPFFHVQPIFKGPAATKRLNYATQTIESMLQSVLADDAKYPSPGCWRQSQRDAFKAPRKQALLRIMHSTPVCAPLEAFVGYDSQLLNLQSARIADTVRELGNNIKAEHGTTTTIVQLHDEREEVAEEAG